MNLETAAVISELIVDRTLDELEGCTGRLVSKHTLMKLLIQTHTHINTYCTTHTLHYSISIHLFIYVSPYHCTFNFRVSL